MVPLIQNESSDNRPTNSISPAAGEMKRMTYAKDWSCTPLGPVDQWPQSLKSAVEIMLNSRYPMLVWWGPQLIQLYNDAYTPVLGLRHPSGLGQPAAQCWSEAWPTVGPLAHAVMTEGVSTWNEQLQIVMTRNGWPEEVYMTFSYSPITDESGQIGGLFCACTEETQRVLGERRLQSLRALAEEGGQADTVARACKIAADTLALNRHDVPFALIYLMDASGSHADLIASEGLDEQSPAATASIPIAHDSKGWPLASVAEDGSAVGVDLTAAGFDPLPSQVWPEPVTRALTLPLKRPGPDRLAGFLVAGISPRLNLDEGYRTFLELAARQVGTAIANARAYEEERRRAEMLAELDRAKTQFFSNVSHEFRTPLTLMLGPLEQLLLREHVPEPEREHLTIAHRSCLRLLKLVNTLLDFSRVEAGRVRAVFEPTDLAVFTADLASNFRTACERAGLQFVVDCPPLPEPVFVDREMWEKIVLNLISNAFKFTFTGTIRVALRCVDNRAELSVSDTGIGIPSDELPRIFQRFHRVASSRGRTYEGTGIGLSLVQELVRHHHGTVAVDSEPGKGTTFRIGLPYGSGHLPPEQIGGVRELASTAIHAEAFVEEALRWTSGEPPLAAAAGGSPPRSANELPAVRTRTSPASDTVLVVDDNADVREYLGRLLATEYNVRFAANGEEALGMALADKPDMVLADIMMPAMDSLELLKALRSHEATRTVPVILLSARAGEEAKVEGLRAGADDYLIKPFSARELLARVGTNLELSRVRREAAEAVRRSEERFRALSNASADVIYWMSADWTEMLRLDGRGFLSDTAGPKRTWLEEYIAAEDRPGVWQAIDKSIRTRSTFELEHRVRRSDGTLGWTFSRAVPLTGPDGEITEWIGSARDVTARHRAEERLRASENRLQRVLETDAVGVLFFDYAGTVVEANDVFLRMTGYTRDEVDRRELTWRRLTPAEWVTESEAQMQKLVSTGRIGPYEQEYLLKDGSRRWMLFTGRDLGDGTVSSYCIDVTDRRRVEAALRESEQRFRLFVDNVQEYALFQTDTEGLVTAWNPGAARLFGYPTEEIVGLHVGLLLTPEDRNNRVLSKEIERVRQSRQMSEDARWLMRRDGTSFWARSFTEPIYDEADRFLGVAKILRDETERQRADDAVRLSLSEKEALLKEVHHRVKNNLQVITSLVNLQAAKVKDPEVLALFQETRSRVQAISSIHELLYQSASFAAIPLRQYTEQLVSRLVRFYGAEGRIAARVTGDGATLELERAVPLGLLLNELVSNACKHAFPGQRAGNVSVSVGCEPRTIVLTVADTGVGLPEGYDYRQATTLGLQLVHGLARQLQAGISMRSGPGTEVVIRIPEDPQSE